MSANGISQRAVDDTSEVIIEAVFHPSGGTQNMTFLAFIIYDDKTNIFFVYSLEDIVEVLAEFLSADAFHCVQGHQISESMHFVFSISYFSLNSFQNPLTNCHHNDILLSNYHCNDTGGISL